MAVNLPDDLGIFKINYKQSGHLNIPCIKFYLKCNEMEVWTNLTKPIQNSNKIYSQS